MSKGKMNIRKDIIFHIDTGCNKDVLKNRVIKDGNSPDLFDKEFDQMIIEKIITIGKVSQFVVVNKFMPNTADKLSKE